MEKCDQKGKQKQGFRSFDWGKWNVKPLNLDYKKHTQQQQQQQQQQYNLEDQIPLPSTSEFNEKSPKTASDCRISNGFSRNQRSHVVEIPETEVGASSTNKEEEEEERKTENSKDGYALETMSNPMEQLIEDSDSLQDVNFISSRFEELKLVSQEPELSEEQLKINDKLQQDEILALEAIYGENVIILHREDGLRSFQINIHIEAPDELQISAKLHSSSGKVNFGGEVGASITRTDHSNEFLYTFNVQYLPPVELTCLLPKSYPSHHYPYFTISVQWLDSIRISDLCQMLDSISMEQSGKEVIYQWAEWLQISSLFYLGFDKEIVLGPYNMPKAGDRRAISRSISPDVDIPSMMNYNDDKSLEIFHQDLHECCICFGQYRGTDFVRLPCKHFFCSKCMKTFSNMHVKEGTVNKLLCPDAKCGVMVPSDLLKRLLRDEAFERWESLLLQKTLEAMPDVVDCPRCDTTCLADEDQQHAQCPKCFFSFCCLCRERRHVGFTCITVESKLEFLQERHSSLDLTDEQKRKERKIINELLSLKEIFRDAKLCPTCKMAISRTEGCNKMVCKNCGKFFCYRCNKAIRGYDHFRGGRCSLFSVTAIGESEARTNVRQVLAQTQDHVFAVHGR